MAFLTDGTVSLRPVEREDLDRLAKWRNEGELRTRTREHRPLNGTAQQEWFARISGPDTHDFMFIVCHHGWTWCGVVGLTHWSPRDRHAEVSFYIGDKGARGKGYCKRALTLLIGWGFEELGLDRIYAEVYTFNEPSANLLRKLGFQEEGMLRKHVWRMGKRWDSVMMGLLREEWQNGEED